MKILRAMAYGFGMFLAAFFFVALAVGQTPTTTNRFTPTSQIEVPSMIGANWTTDGTGYFYYHKDGKACGRVHLGTSTLNGRSFYYASTYTAAGAKHDAKVIPFPILSKAVDFVQGECSSD